MRLRARPRLDGRPGERPLAAERLDERDAERELIGGRRGSQSSELLGRHVGRRAEAGRRGAERVRQQRARHVARRRFVGQFHRRRQTEVGDDHATARVDEDVGGLEVAVDDADLVRRRQPETCLLEQVDDLPPGSRTAAQVLVQRLTIDLFHGDVNVRARLAGVVHGHDVGVPDPRQALRLAQQSQPPLLGGPQIGAQDLERDHAMEHRVVGLVHRPHRSGPEDAADGVTARRTTGPASLGGEQRRHALEARVTRVHVALDCFSRDEVQRPRGEVEQHGFVGTGRGGRDHGRSPAICHVAEPPAGDRPVSEFAHF
ncbi:hypothetical protein OV079_23620 [Nannocystis pusilla]|uniref:Uncharacterized protein n=1 Tax=Nannocystis pusilla TaxID=889268 RepID=A0A9X3EQN4_9BACT|nr:hypothetical protein [Nannocystis pusilla]MCY1008492.1 hypothetical protein [Nannocystis pusilla]